MNPYSISLMLALCIFSISSGNADTHYVTPINPGAQAPYTNWANAATNIQDAVNAASDGDTVLATNGTYVLRGQISISRGVAVRSINGWTNTIVDGNQATRCFSLVHPSAEVDGFIIRYGRATRLSMPDGNGGGVYMTAGTLTNCFVTSNSAAIYGGGIACEGGFIRNCTIAGNSVTNWGMAGGVYCDNASLVENCVIASNFVSGFGGGVACGANSEHPGATVRNCLIADNKVKDGYGGGVECRNGFLENCTVVGNSAYAGGGVSGSGGTLENSIIYFNSASLGANWYSGYGPGSTYSYTCTTPLAPGTWNVSAEPAFMNAAPGDYRLRPGSPCIDSGINQAWMTGAKDLAGNDRVVNSTVDMGAYEFKPGHLLCNFLGDPREGFPPLQVSYQAWAEGTNKAGLFYRWDLNGDGVIDQAGPTRSWATTNYPAFGNYTVRLTVSNALGEVDTLVKPNYVKVGPPITYVSPQGTHTFPYTSWGTAATSIQAAVDAGVDGTVVWVTNGLYVVTNPVSLSSGITVRSVNGASFTTVNGNYPSTTNVCFSLHHPDAIVDGFTITRSGLSGVQCEMGTVRNCDISSNRYGGVECYAQGVVSNCLIRNNSGGVYCMDGYILNCTITGNVSDRGGGVYCQGGAIRNSLIWGNAATNSDWGEGAGVVLNGGAIQNCTIVGNSAGSQAGGLYAVYYGGVVENTVIALNSAPMHPDWMNDAQGGAGMTAVFSSASPLMPGIGNVSGDPGFVDAAHGDCRLLPGSSCINAGTNQAWMVDAVDLAGNNRVLDGTVDIGCYEFKTNGFVCNLVADHREGFPPLNVTLTAYVAGTNTAGLYYRWDLDNDGTVDREGYGLATIATNYHNYGDHSVSLTVSNAAGETATIVKSDYIRTAPAVMYVSQSGNQTYPFTNWATASRSIQEAVKQGIDGCLVWVTNGIYTLTSEVTVTRGITVRSVNGHTNTIVDGNLSTRCFYLAHTNAVVDGFTVTRGYADYGGGVCCEGGTVTNSALIGNSAARDGGGAFCENGGIVANCLVAGNLATNGGWGGGVCLYLGGVVRDCNIRDNASHHGGGVECVYGGLVLGCTISNNTVSSGGGGVECYYGGRAVDCNISSNSAAWRGGAVNCAYGGILTNCTISDNEAVDGSAGVFCDNGGEVLNCLIVGNLATNGSGAGIDCYMGGIVRNCTIAGNTGRWGGGLGFNQAGGLADGCMISNNVATDVGGGVHCYLGGVVSNCVVLNNTALYKGGGANCYFGGKLLDCMIQGNTAADRGGGVECYGAGAWVRNCIITKNYAPTNGGGASCSEGALMQSCLVSGNTCENTGGGLSLYKGRMENCTVARNMARWFGGLWANEMCTVWNSIIYFNTAWGGGNNWGSGGTGNQFAYDCSTPSLPVGTGNIDADPQFIDPSSGNYHLLATSPCINAGTNQDWMIGAVDLDGCPRIQGGIVDMGAYESPPPHSFIAWMQERGICGEPATVFAQDLDTNGVANGFEYTFGTNWVSGQSVLSILLVNGRPVVEVPKQDVGTVPFADLALKACTNLTSPPDGWTLPVGPATNTVGKPANCDWYEPLGAPRNAFFRIEAALRPSP